LKTPYQIQNKIFKNITHTCYFYKIIQILFLLQFYNYLFLYNIYKLSSCKYYKIRCRKNYSKTKFL